MYSTKKTCYFSGRNALKIQYKTGIFTIKNTNKKLIFSYLIAFKFDYILNVGANLLHSNFTITTKSQIND